MKNISFINLLLIMATTAMLFSCGGMKTTVSGLDNIGFLSVYGDASKYPNEAVTVTIDGGKPFVARMITEGQAARKVELRSYKIPTGKHNLRITYAGRILLEKEIILFSQETYKITLP